MDKQPHVRVPNECFFDQPPRPGEPGYDSEYTPLDVRRYIQQQRVLEKAVAANEKFNLEEQLKRCAMRSGSLWNAERQCGELIDQYTRRLRHSSEYGNDLNTVVNYDVLQKDFDGYSSTIYTPSTQRK